MSLSFSITYLQLGYTLRDLFLVYLTVIYGLVQLFLGAIIACSFRLLAAYFELNLY